MNHDKEKLFLNLDQSSIIYVAAPAGRATGGPELLHQLAYHLRVDLGYNAFMYYYSVGSETKNPVPTPYKKYRNPFTERIVDAPENVLIVPEVISALELMRKFSRIQKIVWWLSVHNFVISFVRANYRKFPAVYILARAKRVFKGIDMREFILKRYYTPELAKSLFHMLQLYGVNLHLYQSNYAGEFLRMLGVKNCAYLSDYLSYEFLKAKFSLSQKENIVVFNPLKGYSFTRRIIKMAPDLTFIPIENLSRNEVIELLTKAKVYIDFGDHPGKDRIPREAAMLGCCVIVGRRGSAANQIDVPIPIRYKFEVSTREIPRIVATIRECLSNYEKLYSDFDEYRSMIKQEPHRFLNDLTKIFRRAINQ